MDDETLAVMHELRDFMFERVYQSPTQRDQQLRAIGILRDLMERHLAHPEQIPQTYRQHDAAPVVQVADYVAGMTDRYALEIHERLGA
jgi:dGTPase